MRHTDYKAATPLPRAGNRSYRAAEARGYRGQSAARCCRVSGCRGEAACALRPPSSLRPGLQLLLLRVVWSHGPQQLAARRRHKGGQSIPTCGGNRPACDRTGRSAWAKPAPKVTEPPSRPAEQTGTTAAIPPAPIHDEVRFAGVLRRSESRSPDVGGNSGRRLRSMLGGLLLLCCCTASSHAPGIIPKNPGIIPRILASFQNPGTDPCPMFSSIRCRLPAYCSKTPSR